MQQVRDKRLPRPCTCRGSGRRAAPSASARSWQRAPGSAACPPQPQAARLCPSASGRPHGEHLPRCPRLTRCGRPVGEAACGSRRRWFLPPDLGWGTSPGSSTPHTGWGSSPRSSLALGTQELPAPHGPSAPPPKQTQRITLFGGDDDDTPNKKQQEKTPNQREKPAAGAHAFPLAPS